MVAKQIDNPLITFNDNHEELALSGPKINNSAMPG
jgi:hypothetical protein